MIFEQLAFLFSDHTLKTVTLGALIIGVTAGSLGAFAVLRRQSLLGDAIAHAALPGVCIAFILTQSKSPAVLLLGAAISGWLGSIAVNFIANNTNIKRDTALGIILSVFFGIGILLITIVQKLPTATKAGLDKFLFGNAATLLSEDITVMAVLSGVVFCILFLFWKEFKVLVFDPDFARSIGLRIHLIDVILTTLIVIALVIGLQTVGVVLMSAMLVAPAASARQWTDRLDVMVILAAVFGAVCGVAGALTSSLVTNLPTGPTIVVYISIVVFFSLLFAPHRGLVWDWVREYRNRRRIQTTAVLKNLLLFSEIQTDPFHPHDVAALAAIGRGTLRKTMTELFTNGWVKEFPDKRWALTPEGLAEAKRLTKEYEEQFNVGSTS